MLSEKAGKSKNRDNGIQVLRAVSCLMIMLFHSGAGFASLFWGGIIAFFMMSSYYLTLKMMRNDSLSFTEQICHRIKRLYPAYMAVIVVGIIDVIARGGVFPVK